MAPDCKSGARKRYAGSNPALPSVRGRCIVVMPLPSKQESRVRFPPPAPKKACKHRRFCVEEPRLCPNTVHAPKKLLENKQLRNAWVLTEAAGDRARCAKNSRSPKLKA
jgi:hypothetical protein